MSTMYGGSGYGRPLRGPTGQATLDWISEAWTLFSQNAGTWIAAILVSAVLPLVIYMIASMGMGLGMMGAIIAAQNSGKANPANPFWLFGALPLAFILVVVVLGFLYTPFMYGGIYGMAVKQVRGEPIALADIFGGGPVMLRMFGLVCLLYVGGLLLQFAFSTLPALALHLGGTAGGSSNTPGFPSMAQGGAAIGFLFLYLIALFAYYTLILPTLAMVADRKGVFAAIGLSVAGMAKDIGRGALVVFVLGLLLFISAIPCGLGLFVTLPMLCLISAIAYRDMVGIDGMVASVTPVYGAPQTGVWPPPPGQAPPPAWGQTQGQTPPSATPPTTPPRTSLSGDSLDNPPDNTPPPA